jgi:hypothetical protein
MVLPGDATASSVRADPATWLVGARPSAAATALARAAGGRRITAAGWEVPRSHARALAGKLRRRGLLTYAEPNSLQRMADAPRAVPNDPLSAQYPWRDRAVDPSLTPPPVTSSSPALALVDARADKHHPEFAGGHLRVLSGQHVTIEHGTATAAVAGALQNNVGMVGVWPGMSLINVPLPADNITCAASARGVERAIGAGAAVINMSYGSSSFCETEYEALENATAHRIVLVAAAGNEFDQGNPLEFPASLPHVLTIGALDPHDAPTYFSNENVALDLSAPGQDIVTAVPPALDADGNPDGYEVMDGTSFSAPMVAAAAAWLREARPNLTYDQVFEVLRVSARDINTPGYDDATGFGALDLAAALTRKPPGITRNGPPVADPQEPNEDIPFVNGSVFGRPHHAIWSGHGTRRLEAFVDLTEDPQDVYRVRVPAHRRVTITVRPGFGDPDLALFDRHASDVHDRKHRIARSRHHGSHRDRVRWRNTSAHRRAVYVNVYEPNGRSTLDAGYTLVVR